ncbi:MAG: hypothetical protein IPN94_04215 [Sphingobacteriales bacterium]|nr:hypothetical protein [Sphingobacteriales bacterium]
MGHNANINLLGIGSDADVVCVQTPRFASSSNSATISGNTLICEGQLPP